VDRVGEWRLIDSDETELESKPPDPKHEQGGTDRKLLVGVVVVVLALAGAAIWLTLPQPAVRLDIAGAAISTDLTGSGASPGTTTAAAPAEIVVDVQGAVASPGLHRLSTDSRVGDAIAAAGGYSPLVDIAAAAARLNLAERLTDGAKVHVPARGEVSVAATDGAAPVDTIGPAPGGGLIDVNHASAEELDTLPGIGPVTADKIISARAEALFASVEDLLARSVVGPSTMDKIRDLITALP
jgi:competence protein ComEA